VCDSRDYVGKQRLGLKTCSCFKLRPQATWEQTIRGPIGWLVMDGSKLHAAENRGTGESPCHSTPPTLMVVMRKTLHGGWVGEALLGTEGSNLWGEPPFWDDGHATDSANVVGIYG
jgi:hypothetical protein